MQSMKGKNMAYLKTKPYAIHRDEGRKFQSSEASVVVAASAEQTGGTFNLFEMTCRAGFATSLHIHYAEDVAIYVLEGRLTFFWGGEKKEAQAGSYFYQPRCTPHGFRVEGDAPARILYMTFPAGLDRFVVEQESLTPLFDSVKAAARNKIEILGLLPE